MRRKQFSEEQIIGILMEAQATAERNGWPRLVAHQVYYSLICRAYEADLMPLGADQGVGALVT